MSCRVIAHISDAAVRALFEEAWSVKLQSEPGLAAFRTCSMPAVHGSFPWPFTAQGEDIGSIRSEYATRGEGVVVRWNASSCRTSS